MTEQYILHGMRSFKYGFVGGLLLAMFELNNDNYLLVFSWLATLITIQVLHYQSLEQALSNKAETTLQQPYILGVLSCLCWLAFLFIFGWNDDSGFMVFWRGSIIMIMLIFYRDAMQYAPRILLTYTTIICLGLMIYLNGFINVPSDCILRMTLSICLATVAILLSGLSNFQHNLEAAKVVTQNNRLIIELDEMLTRDSLTKIHNRRYFDAQLTRFIALFRQIGEPFCLVIMDVDHFKKINDTHGHLAGDVALLQLSTYVSQTLRGSDVFARYGGEEFVMLLPISQINTAHRTMNKLRESIQNHAFLVNGDRAELTVSMGITRIEAEDTAESILSRADRALYEAKKSGRNKVVAA